MTSRTDTDEHPEVSEISALTDGLLSPSRSADLRDHLACCELCEDVHASLEEIRGLLGTLPGPARMPEDVAGRIDAALAAEALLNSTAPEDDDAVSRETAPSVVTTRVSRETTPADTSDGTAAQDRPAGRPRGATGPGRQTPGIRSTRARRWPRVLLGTAAAVAVLGIGGIVVQNMTSASGSGGEQHGAVPEKSSNSDVSTLSSSTLEEQVHGLLAGSGPNKAPRIGTRSASETPLRAGSDAVPSCVRKGIGRSETPLAATEGTYEGRNAYLVVLPHPSDATQVSAYVVSASCASASPPVPGEVLLSGSYRRE